MPEQPLEPTPTEGVRVALRQRKSDQRQAWGEGRAGPGSESNGTAVIVGASLSGLMSALSLSREGVSVTMLERSASKARAGAALPVSEGLLQRLTGRDAGPTTLPSGPQAWADVQSEHYAARTYLTLRSGNSRLRLGQSGLTLGDKPSSTVSAGVPSSARR